MTTSPIPQGYERGLVPALMLPLARELLSRVPVAPGARVLDAAAGTGALARLLPRARVVAADSWDDMVAFARGVVPSARWTLADVERLPFHDGAFDVALCQHGLPFAEDPARAVAELARVAPRVGVLLWTGLAESPGFRALDEAARKRLGQGLALRFDDALETEAGLRGLFEKAGMGVTVERLRREARFASGAAFAEAYVAGSSLSEAEAIDEAREGLLRDVDDALRPWTGPHGLAFPVEVHVAVGSRGAQL